MSHDDWRTWPALSGLGMTRRWRLRGTHGVSSSTGAAPGGDWQVGDGHRAGWVGDGQRHELVWANPAGLPAALGALALLERVAGLTAAAAAPVPVGALDTHVEETTLATLIDDGRQALARCVGMDDLGRAYGCLLAGNPLVLLPVAAPADAAALAVLLLPLSRDLADGLALGSGTPPGSARGLWLVPRGVAVAAPAVAPTPAQLETGLELARALLGAFAISPATPAPAPTPWQDLESLQLPQPQPAEPPGPPQTPPAGARTLRLWGAASSGKTVYLAQLFTRYHHGGDPDWSVRLPPGVNQGWFEARLAGFEEQNRFPEPTPAGAADQVMYWLVNEAAGRRAMIAVEDRPGRDYETFDADTARRLAAADGLLLLLDPLRDAATQNEEVTRGLLAMQQARGSHEPDPRPLALCVSKCDALIGSAADLRRAQDDPAGFLERHIGTTIAEAVRHYFRRHRLFALSAAGLRVSHGAVLPAVFHDEQLELRISRAGVPLNLLAPLIWLLDEIGA